MATINKNCLMSAKPENPSNMLQFISSMLQTGTQYDARKFRRKWFDTAKDLYQKDLVAHFGCVNAIEFSDCGDLLFSGGDDLKVLMWKVNDAMVKEREDLLAPVAMQETHDSNVFCLAVDPTQERVLSGSNDNQIIIHDYKVGKCIRNIIVEGSVFSISMHPAGGEFVYATDDGQVAIFDPRIRDDGTTTVAVMPSPFHGVMYHPAEPWFVASANSKLGIHIWDTRKPLEPVQECCKEQGMAVRWNKMGSRLLCVRNLMPPMLMDPMNPEHRLEFDAKSYYIACTMKSCCFAGDNDEYILSGSDDFNVYMWKIPDPWPESNWVGSEKLLLRGHRSIVNQVRYCPSKQLIASSGVEKVIKLWSADQMPSSYGNRDVARADRGRLLCSAGPCKRSTPIVSDLSPESVEEDRQMLHFFDSLLRNEFSSRTSPVALPDSPRSANESPLGNNHYGTLIRRKKKFLMRNMTHQKPNICSLRSNALRLRSWYLPDDQNATTDECSDLSQDSSDDSGLNRSRVEEVTSPKSSSSHTIVISSSSSSSSSEGNTPSKTVRPRDSGVHESPSSEETTTHVVLRRVNQSERCYRIKLRPADSTSHLTSSESSSGSDSDV